MSTSRNLPRIQSRGFVSLGLILLLMLGLAAFGGAGWWVTKPHASPQQAPIATSTMPAANATSSATTPTTTLSPQQAAALVYKLPQNQHPYRTTSNASENSFYCGDKDYLVDANFYYFRCSVLVKDGHRVTTGSYAVNKYTGAISAPPLASTTSATPSR